GAGRQQGVTVDAAGTHQPDHPHPYLGGLDRVRARAMTRAVVAGGSRLNKAGGLRLPDCTSGTRRGQRSPAGVVGSHRPRSARPPARPGRDPVSRLAGSVSVSRSWSRRGLTKGETHGAGRRESPRRSFGVVRGSGGTPPPLPRLPRGRPMAGGVLVGVGVGEHEVTDVTAVPVGLAHLVGDAVEVGALVVIVTVER